MPWFFEYTIHPNGPVTARIVWAQSATLSMAKQITFRRLEDLPPRVLEAVIDDMGKTGKASGSVALPQLTDVSPTGRLTVAGDRIPA